MKILPILLATTLTIYTNAAFLPLTVYAAEESASAEESAAAEVETEQEGEVQEQTAEELTAEVPDAGEPVT